METWCDVKNAHARCLKISKEKILRILLNNIHGDFSDPVTVVYVDKKNV